MIYENAVSFINGFTHSGAPQTDLSRFRQLCGRLGDPQERLKFLHVAGTNGKGSACAYLDAALRKAGYRTGCFTSPYIVDLRERIRLDGENIPESSLADCTGRVKAAAEGCARLSDYSQFEIFTAAAFVYYEQAGADFVVLETGIGGLYDCTSVVTPVLSLITRIDYDHQALLGRTIPEIAAHKAGIIKAGMPSFCSPFQRAEALSVLRKKAEELGSPFTEADGNELHITKNSLFGTEFFYKGRRFATAMGGAHQPENAAAAIEALRFLKIPDEIIADALKTAVLPARMQVYSREPPVIIDGGHNESGAAAAASLLEAEGMRPVMVLGMLTTKEWEKALALLLKRASRAVFTDSFYPQAVPAERLCAFAEKMGVPAKAVPDTRDALTEALSAGQPTFVGGSLYLAGEALRTLGGGVV